MQQRKRTERNRFERASACMQFFSVHSLTRRLCLSLDSQPSQNLSFRVRFCFEIFGTTIE